MQDKEKIKKTHEKPLSGKILDYLGETSKNILDASVRVVFDFKSVHREVGISLYGNSFYYFPREISNLKKSAYFSYEEGKFYLTDKGRIKIIESILKKKKITDKKWDGLWRGIIFDIPEASRKERAFLRKELRWVGCKEIQKSVWITPLDIEKELLAILKLWKQDFSGDIRFLKIERITGEDEIKKYFEI